MVEEVRNTKAGNFLDRMTGTSIDYVVEAPARRRNDELTNLEQIKSGAEDLADYAISTHLLHEVGKVAVGGVALPYQGALGRVVGEINGL